jgi:hypothetical protein
LKPRRAEKNIDKGNFYFAQFIKKDKTGLVSGNGQTITLLSGSFFDVGMGGFFKIENEIYVIDQVISKTILLLTESVSEMFERREYFYSSCFGRVVWSEDDTNVLILTEGDMFSSVMVGEMNVNGINYEILEVIDTETIRLNGNFSSITTPVKYWYNGARGTMTIAAHSENKATVQWLSGTKFSKLFDTTNDLGVNLVQYYLGVEIVEIAEVLIENISENLMSYKKLFFDLMEDVCSFWIVNDEPKNILRTLKIQNQLVLQAKSFEIGVNFKSYYDYNHFGGHFSIIFKNKNISRIFGFCSRFVFVIDEDKRPVMLSNSHAFPERITYISDLTCVFKDGFFLFLVNTYCNEEYFTRSYLLRLGEEKKIDEIEILDVFFEKYESEGFEGVETTFVETHEETHFFDFDFKSNSFFVLTHTRETKRWSIYDGHFYSLVEKTEFQKLKCFQANGTIVEKTQFSSFHAIKVRRGGPNFPQLVIFNNYAKTGVFLKYLACSIALILKYDKITEMYSLGNFQMFKDGNFVDFENAGLVSGIQSYHLDILPSKHNFLYLVNAVLLNNDPKFILYVNKTQKMNEVFCTNLFMYDKFLGIVSDDFGLKGFSKVKSIVFTPKYDYAVIFLGLENVILWDFQKKEMSAVSIEKLYELENPTEEDIEFYKALSFTYTNQTDEVIVAGNLIATLKILQDDGKKIPRINIKKNIDEEPMEIFYDAVVLE